MRALPLRPLALLAAGMLIVGCAEERAAAEGFVVRDSAGVTIVESAAPRWGEGEEWRLSEVPVVEIGVVEGTPEYQLSGVTGAARLSDGRIAVGDQGSHSVRYYDPDGRHRKSVGGRGEGPGEFGRMRRVDRLQGDTLAVLDGVRVTLIDGEGSYARTIGPVDPMTALVGWFDDGTALAMRTPMGRPSEGDGPDSLTVLRVDLSVQSTSELGRYVFRREIWGSGRRTVFSPRPALVQAPDGYLYGYSDTFELRTFTPQGAPVRIIRKGVTPRVVTAAHRERYESAVDEARERGAPSRWLSDELSFAETLPAFRRVQSDRAGYLWVETFEPHHEIIPGQPFAPVPTPDTHDRWSVFDEEGAWLGEVEMPARFTPIEIGDDYVLGLVRDELDVEYVRMYKLVKPEES